MITWNRPCVLPNRQIAVRRDGEYIVASLRGLDLAAIPAAAVASGGDLINWLDLLEHWVGPDLLGRGDGDTLWWTQ